MTIADETTALNVIAYREGHPFMLDVREVECGHYLDARLAKQACEAIRVAREHGLHVSIQSAWRTMEKQQELYNGWCAGKKGFNPADKPGFSKHQEGCAIDLAFGTISEREEFAALAIAHGFSRPHPKENWHFVLAPQKPEPLT